ncbi:hypothetical protein [Brevibacillus fulvus]|uniref:Uncharacterized protein n=1 Tax=Brevibacillus fulvus TaxID=1125967 RepID=A0A938XZ37_9BACL|nr:hypothetical protein [Brevibacillus fulvus]MBM7590844.1 hypothetical protein [Brevibacillus fulvus]
MNQELKQKYPAWCSDNDFGKFDTVLGDDADSLISCSLLKHIKGYTIKWFYDFSNMFGLDLTSKKEPIGVDMALVHHKTWDNHVTMLHANDYFNPQSANINNIKKNHRGHYGNKYAGSTLLQIWSYYDIPLPQSERGKQILLAVDIAFKGHYNSRFNPIHNSYLKELGFEELIDVLNRHSIKEMYQIVDEYNLYGKIKIDDNGILTTDINLAKLQGFFDFQIALPNEPFQLVRRYKRKGEDIDGRKSFDMNKMFSFALTFQNHVSYTEKMN